MEPRKHFEDDKAKIYLANGIMYAHYKTHKITKEIARTYFFKCVSIQNGIKMPAFVDITNIKVLEKEARAFYASDELAEYSKGIALYTNSTFSKLIANFFMQIDKPVVPTKMFTDKTKALDWLRERMHDE